MKLTLQAQLLPDADSAAKLRATVERFNEAAAWLAGVAFERKLSNKFALQKIVYVELRERFGLPADTAIRCIAQVVEAYKRDKAVRPKFRKHAAVPFSMGKNIGFKGPDRVSISTLTGAWLSPSSWGSIKPSVSVGPRASVTSYSARMGSGFCSSRSTSPTGRRPRRVTSSGSTSASVTSP